MRNGVTVCPCRQPRAPQADAAGPEPAGAGSSTCGHGAASITRCVLQQVNARKARNDLRDGLGGRAGGSSDACAYVRIGQEITVQINSETERRMWDVSNLPPFKSAAEESQQNFINKTRCRALVLLPSPSSCCRTAPLTVKRFLICASVRRWRRLSVISAKASASSP